MTPRPDLPAATSTQNDTEAREALRQRARDAIARQPARTVTVLSSLLAVHDELGYLPEEAVEEVAIKTASSPNTVWGVASFYPNFRFSPPNRHVVELCWGPTCHVLGAQPILQRMLAHLRLPNEGDTEDGVISFKLNTCLGVCAHGPAMTFDEELTGHLDPERAVRLVERVKADDEEEQKALAVAKETEASRRELREKTVAIAKERAERAEAETKARADADTQAWEQYIEEAKAKVAAEEKAKAEERAKAEEQASAEERVSAQDKARGETIAAGNTSEDDAPAQYAPSDEAPISEGTREESGLSEETMDQLKGSEFDSDEEEPHEEKKDD